MDQSLVDPRVIRLRFSRNLVKRLTIQHSVSIYNLLFKASTPATIRFSINVKSQDYH